MAMTGNSKFGMHPRVYSTIPYNLATVFYHPQKTPGEYNPERIDQQVPGLENTRIKRKQW